MDKPHFCNSRSKYPLVNGVMKTCLYNQAMATTILSTKLHIPRTQPRVVLWSRLIERLNEALHHKLTLLSVPAGFGKTTLLSEWVAASERPVPWLSLWGLIAAIPYVLVYLLKFFGIDPGLEVLTAPLALQEMVMALWLIIRGFNKDAAQELDEAYQSAP